MILSLQNVPPASFAGELAKAPKSDRQIAGELYHTATYAAAGLSALLVNTGPVMAGKPAFAKLVTATYEAAPKLQNLLRAIDPTYEGPSPNTIKLPFANPRQPTIDEVDSTLATVALNVLAIEDHYQKSASPGAKEKTAAATETAPALAKLLEAFRGYVHTLRTS